jgi:hypothetical protein
MATRAARIEQFIFDQTPPEGGIAKLLCEDRVGTYMIPFPCRYSEGTCLNERTGELNDADVIGWCEWSKHV